MLFRPRQFASLQLDSAPAIFGEDVFVDRRLPWLGFLQSVGCHVLVLAALLMASRILALQPQAAVQPTLPHADVIYYTPSEYLPTLDTRVSEPQPAQNADPEYSPQPIISVPPEADNRQQTIVAPPRVKLDRDLAVPSLGCYLLAGSAKFFAQSVRCFTGGVCVWSMISGVIETALLRIAA